MCCELIQLVQIDKFPGEGFKLSSGSSSSQQQVQTLPRQHVAQDSQQPLWRLGVVCIHRLEDVCDSGLCPQDQPGVGLDVGIFS